MGMGVVSEERGGPFMHSAFLQEGTWLGCTSNPLANSAVIGVSAPCLAGIMLKLNVCTPQSRDQNLHQPKNNEGIVIQQLPKFLAG